MTAIDMKDIERVLNELKNMDPEDIRKMLDANGIEVKVKGDDSPGDIIEALGFRNLMEAMKFFDVTANILNHVTVTYEEQADENGMLGDCRSRLEAIGCALDGIMRQLEKRIHSDPDYEDAKECYIMQEESRSSNETRKDRGKWDSVMFG